MKPVLCFLLLTFASAGYANELTGTWVLSIDTPRGTQNPTLEVMQDEDRLYGVYQSLRGPLKIESIQFDGTQFSFPLKIQVPIGEIEVTYRGQIEGQTMRGMVQNPRGEVPFSGQRRLE